MVRKGVAHRRDAEDAEDQKNGCFSARPEGTRRLCGSISVTPNLNTYLRAEWLKRQRESKLRPHDEARLASNQVAVHLQPGPERLATPIKAVLYSFDILKLEDGAVQFREEHVHPCTG